MNLILIQILSCAFLCGLIWTIQILHYPSFAYVSENRFQIFHSFHTKNITYVVLPVMLLELVTAAALVYYHTHSKLLWLNLIGVCAIWVFTFLVSVRLHNELAKTFSLQVMNRLVLTNWIRTLLWSGRIVVLAFIFLKATQGINVDIS